MMENIMAPEKAEELTFWNNGEIVLQITSNAYGTLREKWQRYKKIIEVYIEQFEPEISASNNRKETKVEE
jgi:hypothetical protein